MYKRKGAQEFINFFQLGLKEILVKVNFFLQK